MTILALIEALILVALAVYAIRLLVTDATAQRVMIGLVLIVLVLWVIEGANVFGASFHQPLFGRRG